LKSGVRSIVAAPVKFFSNGQNFITL